MANKDLALGEVVVLSRHHVWAVGENNPLTKYGIVTTCGEMTIRVLWLNGFTNTYSPEAEDLVPAVHVTREMCRAAARNNPNLMVVPAQDGLWKLMFRPRMVINDNREQLQ